MKQEEEFFYLSDSLLRDYPGMRELSGMLIDDAPDDTWTVSAAYVDLRTVEECLPNVEAGRQTIKIESGLRLVGECLDKLAATGRYDRFVSAERRKFNELSSRASELIGSKVRYSDSVYR